MTRGIYSFAPLNGWNDVQLTKNCGLLLYLFHKMFGFRAVMVGTKLSDYPSRRYVPGVELSFLPDASLKTKLSFLAAQAEHIDVLVLHGLTAPDYYEALVDLYRRCRPDGKVYFELDINRYHASRIAWSAHPDFLRLLSQCDVIGASCRRMQRVVARRWPCVIDYLPNGFYNYAMDGKLPDVDFRQKEKIILTVGRLGTSQKNIELLVKAFLRAAPEIPGWRCLFVGSQTDGFAHWLEKVLSEHPALRGRLVATGPVFEKKTLMSLYARAKIFALTSDFEGGTPNVVAEALFNGDYMMTSDIESAADMVDGGACGDVFPLGDDAALARLLISRCREPERLEAGGRAACALAEREYDFRRIARRLYLLLYGEVPPCRA